MTLRQMKRELNSFSTDQVAVLREMAAIREWTFPLGKDDYVELCKEEAELSLAATHPDDGDAEIVRAIVYSGFLLDVASRA